MAEYSRFSLSFDPSNLSPLSNSLSGRRLISYKHCYSSLCHKVAPLRNVVMLQRNSTSIKPWKLCRNPDLERLVSVLCRSIGFFNSHSKLQSREAISEGSTIQQYKISSVSRLEIRACVSTPLFCLLLWAHLWSFWCPFLLRILIRLFCSSQARSLHFEFGGALFWFSIPRLLKYL